MSWLGDIVLINLAEVGGDKDKLRPALVLAELPGAYQNLLDCGVSTQFREAVSGWDEPILSTDPEFSQTGLRRDSIVRLSYLYAAERNEIVGTIGTISADRLNALRSRLSQHLSIRL